MFTGSHERIPPARQIAETTAPQIAQNWGFPGGRAANPKSEIRNPKSPKGERAANPKSEI
jgi:hypothetical protein